MYNYTDHLDRQVKEKLLLRIRKKISKGQLFKNASGSAEVLDKIDEGDSPIP